MRVLRKDTPTSAVSSSFVVHGAENGSPFDLQACQPVQCNPLPPVKYISPMIQVGLQERTMPALLGMNGFGRIGMLVFRAASADPDVKVVAVNDPLMPLDYLVYQLQYDSVHGRVNGTIAMSEEDGKDFLTVNVFHEGSSCHRLRSHWFLLRLRDDWHLHAEGQGRLDLTQC